MALMRIKMRAYEHELLDETVAMIVDLAKSNGVAVKGPIPLPTKREVFTILRAVHKYKDSREQFERRTYKRLVDLVNPSSSVVEKITQMTIPAGVEIEIK
jgi:small subunit ribosomal protein S10